MERVRHARTILAAVAALSVVLALALGLSACGSTGTAVSDSSGTAAGGDAAPSFSGVTLAGETVSLDQYRGKPLLLVYMTYT